MQRYLKNILFFCALFYLNISSGQKVFFQDIYNGGVSGGGGSTGAGSGTFFFDVYIEQESTIRKAFLIAGCDGKPDDITITMNGLNYEFNSSNIESAPKSPFL
jgi:hypothetical protein